MCHFSRDLVGIQLILSTILGKCLFGYNVASAALERRIFTYFFKYDDGSIIVWKMIVLQEFEYLFESNGNWISQYSVTCIDVTTGLNEGLKVKKYIIFLSAFAVGINLDGAIFQQVINQPS